MLTGPPSPGQSFASVRPPNPPVITGPPAPGKTMPRIDPATGSPYPAGASDTEIGFHEGTLPGPMMVVNGIRQMFGYGGTPYSSAPVQGPRPGPRTWTQTANDAMEGGVKALSPMTIPGMIMAPGVTIPALAGGAIGQKGGESIATAMHAYPDTARLVGNATGLAAGAAAGIGAPKVWDAIPRTSRAGANFDTVMSGARNIPIDTSQVAPIVERAQQLGERGATVPKVVNSVADALPRPGIPGSPGIPKSTTPGVYNIKMGDLHRVATNPYDAAKLAQAKTATSPDQFPPIRLSYNRGLDNLMIDDGNHRLEAARSNNFPYIRGEVQYAKPSQLGLTTFEKPTAPVPPTPPITYEAGRDFASNAGRLSAQDSAAMNGPMGRQVKLLASALDTANREAAVKAGLGDKYDAAMKEYRQANQLKTGLKTAAKVGGSVLGLGVAGNLARKYLIGEP